MFPQPAISHRIKCEGWIIKKERGKIRKEEKSMPCTTILVGKKASLDGSTMIARNDDTFMPLTPQRFYMNQLPVLSYLLS